VGGEPVGRRLHDVDLRAGRAGVVAALPRGVGLGVDLRPLQRGLDSVTPANAAWAWLIAS
jgi:hypothetical protein